MEKKETNFINKLSDIARGVVVLPSDSAEVQEAKRKSGYFIEASGYYHPEIIQRVVAKLNESGIAARSLSTDSRADWLLILLATNPQMLGTIGLSISEARNSSTYSTEILIRVTKRLINLLETDNARNPGIDYLNVCTRRLSGLKSLYESLTEKSKTRRERL